MSQVKTKKIIYFLCPTSVFSSMILMPSKEMLSRMRNLCSPELFTADFNFCMVSWHISSPCESHTSATPMNLPLKLIPSPSKRAGSVLFSGKKKIKSDDISFRFEFYWLKNINWKGSIFCGMSSVLLRFI